MTSPAQQNRQLQTAVCEAIGRDVGVACANATHDVPTICLHS